MERRGTPHPHFHIRKHILFAAIATEVLAFAFLAWWNWPLVQQWSIDRAYAASTVPKVINYQARITDASGVPVPDGSLSIKAAIYDAPTGGTCLYEMRGSCGTPTAKTVTVSSGAFSTLIGDTGDNAIPDNLFDNNTLYLGITVGSDAEMTPRKRIGSSGYAFNADRLDNLDTSSAGGTGAYVPVTDSAGNLTITGLAKVLSQSASPSSNLFQIANANDSTRYFTVSSTSTRINTITPVGIGQLVLQSPFANNPAMTLRSTDDQRLGQVYSLNNVFDLSAWKYGGAGGIVTISTEPTGGSGVALERVRVDQAGNVGIGWNSPGARLTVADGLTSPTNNVFQITNANDSARYFTVSSTSTHVFGNLTIDGACTGCGGGSATSTLNADYIAATGTPQISLNGTNGLLRISDTVGGLGTDLIQITNRNAANAYTTKYFSVSATTTLISGIVGVGSSDPTLFSPNIKLHVAGGDIGLGRTSAVDPSTYQRLGHSDDANFYSYLANNATWNGSNWIPVNSSGWGGNYSLLRNENGRFDFYTGTQSGGIITLGTPVMSMTNAGRVGIGISSPSYPLDVSNASGIAARISSNDTSGSVATLFVNNAGGGFGLPVISLAKGGALMGDVIGYDSNAFGLVNGITISAASGKSIGFRVGGSTEAARFDSTGKLGIGTSAPTNLLDIKGSGASFYPILLESTSNQQVGMAYKNSGREWLMGMDGLNNGGDDFFIYDLTATAFRFNITSTGNVGISDNTPTARLVVADGLASPTGNIFQVTNANDSARYMTVSSTGTILTNLTITGTCTGCGGGSSTLQGAYNSSTSPELALDATRGALTVRDASSPVGNLFELQSSNGGSSYFTASSTNTVIGSASNTSVITPNAWIAGNLTPSVDNAYSLGDYNRRWKDLWLSGGTAHIAYDQSGTTVAQLGFETTQGLRTILQTPTDVPIQLRAGDDGTFAGNHTSGIYLTSNYVQLLGSGAFSATPNTDGGMTFNGTVTNWTTAYNSSPLAGLTFATRTTDTSLANLGGIALGKENATNNNAASYMSLYTRPNSGGITEVVRINSAGDVGIGNTSPQTLLAVGPNVTSGFNSNELVQLAKTGDAYMTIRDGTANFIFGTTSGIPFAGSQTNSDFTLRTNNAEKVRITAAGNFGIGDASPAALLTVGNGDRFQVDSNGNITWPNAATIALANTTNSLNIDSNTLVVDALNNRVGIGTSSPAGPVHILTTGSFGLKVENTDATNYANLRVKGTGHEYALGVGGGSESLFSVANKFYIYDETAAAMRVALDASGNFGIGTTTPTAALTLRDLLASPAGNILQVSNANDSARYFTVSSTSTHVYGNLTIDGTCTGCGGGGSSTLQQTYANSTSPELTLDATRGALTIRDAVTAVGNLLELQNNVGSTSYFTASSTGTSINGTLTASGTTTLDNGSSAVSYSVASTTFSAATLDSGATSVTLTDDSVSSAIALPFSFLFFGKVETTAYIGSNGFVCLSSNTSCNSNGAQTIPNAAAPNELIAGYWRDLNPGAGGTIKYETFGSIPNRTFVVEFNNVPCFSGCASTVTFQIKIFEGTNTIEIHSANLPSATATQGLESAGGTSAAYLTGRDNATFSATNDAVRFSQPTSTELYVNGYTGIGDSTPASLFTVGYGDLFQVNSSGNIAMINNVPYSWPYSQGATGSVLEDDGSGNLTWAPKGGLLNLQQAYNNSTSTTEISLSPSLGALTIADTSGGVGDLLEITNQNNTGSYLAVSSTSTRVYGAASPTTNIFQVGNGNDSTRYFTVSSTSTLVNPTNSSTFKFGFGVTSPLYRFDVTSASATERVAIIKRGNQGSDPSLSTTYGHPYLQIGGAEYVNNVLQTIGFGYVTNATDYAPAEMGLLTDNIGGNESGNLVFATRNSTSNIAPSERMRIQSNGNVGIGTTSAGALLTVGGNAAMMNGGRLGIGTTSPQVGIEINQNPTDSSQPTGLNGANSDTHTGLFISGTGNTTGEKLGMQFGLYNGYSIGGIFGTMTNAGGNTIGDLTWDMRTSFSDTALTEKMRLTSAGNLGIGDSSPAALFTVGNGDRFQVDSSGNITWPNAATITLANVTNALNIDSNTLVVDALNNRVGIGTTAPTARLTVQDAPSPVGNLFQIADANDSSRYFTVSSTATFVTGAFNDTGLSTLDSGEPAGSYSVSSVSYSAQTLDAGATSVSLADDAVSSAITLPFTFSFFGTSQTTVYIGSNGYVCVGSSTSCNAYQTQTIPNTTAPNGLIAGFWRDLSPQNGGTIKYETFGTTPNRIFVVEFSGVPCFTGCGSTVSFQIQLYETSNKIEIHSANLPSATATQGVENSTGTRGLYYPGRDNATFSATNDGVRFSQLPATALYVNGSVGIGDSTPNALFTVGSGDRFQIDASGNITWPNAATVTLASAANALNFDANTLDIDASNHRVGIGTATPAALLSVGSGSPFQVNSSGNVSTSGTITSTASSGNTLVVNSTDLVVDSTNHRVGVHTNAPLFPLDFGSTTGNDIISLYNSGTSTYSYGIGVQSGSFDFNLAHNLASFYFYDDVAHTNELMQLDGNGKLKISTLNTSLNGLCHASTTTSGTGVVDEVEDCSGAPSDVAEWYPSADDSATSSDILVITDASFQYGEQLFNPRTGLPTGATGTYEVSVLDRSSTPYDTRIIGIVSTSPNQIFGEAIRDSAPHAVPMAIAGRVPTRVTDENGPIRAGDPITTSSTAGAGMKATKPGMIVGYALGSWSGPGEGVIQVLVHPEWSGNGSATDTAATGFSITPDAQLDFQRSTITNLAAIVSSSGNWSVTEDGYLVVKHIDAQQVETQNLTMKVLDETSRTVGHGILKAGYTGAFIQNPNAHSNSLIVVTFEGNVGSSWWISEKDEGAFMVTAAAPATGDIPFTYWIVGVDGSLDTIASATDTPLTDSGSGTPQTGPPLTDSGSGTPQTGPPLTDSGSGTSQTP